MMLGSARKSSVQSQRSGYGTPKRGQNYRSVPFSSRGVGKRTSYSTIRRSTRSVILPINENQNLEHHIIIPPDGGYGWFIVLIAFIANFLIDGVTYAFGIFLNEISETFKVDASEVAIISSYMSGLYFLTGPLSCALCNRYGFRFVGMLGGLLSAGIFIWASFLESFICFTIITGICAGISFNFVYTPTLLVVGFYFEKYRALTTAISVCGTSCGIMIFPMIFQNDFLLGTYHWRMKFRLISGTFILLSFLVLAFKPITPTRVLENAGLEDIDSSSTGTFYLDSEDPTVVLNFRRLFNEYHNAVYPTVADFHSKKPDEISAYLAILPEVDDYDCSSVDHSVFQQQSITSEYQSMRSRIMSKTSFLPPVTVSCGFWDCFRCHKDSNREPKKVTPPYALTRWRSECCECCDSKCALSRIFFCNETNLNRPMYRDDILYQGSLAYVPEYTQASSKITVTHDVQPTYTRNIGYHMSVSRVISQKDAEEQQKCLCCPEAVVRVLITMVDIRLFQSIAFSVLTISGFLTMVGLYIPFVFIVERGKELNFEGNWPALLLTIMGFANTIGRILCGVISFFPSINPLFLSWVTLILAGMATVLSAFTDAFSLQIIAMVIFSVCVASFTTLRTVLLVNILGLENLTNAFGITILFYGLANFMGIPLSSYLVQQTGSYAYCFLISGIALILSGICLIPVNRINEYEKNKKRPRVQFQM